MLSLYSPDNADSDTDSEGPVFSSQNVPNSKLIKHLFVPTTDPLRESSNRKNISKIALFIRRRLIVWSWRAKYTVHTNKNKKKGIPKQRSQFFVRMKFSAYSRDRDQDHPHWDDSQYLHHLKLRQEAGGEDDVIANSVFQKPHPIILYGRRAMALLSTAIALIVLAAAILMAVNFVSQDTVHSSDVWKFTLLAVSLCVSYAVAMALSKILGFCLGFLRRGFLGKVADFIQHSMNDVFVILFVLTCGVLFIRVREGMDLLEATVTFYDNLIKAAFSVALLHFLFAVLFREVSYRITKNAYSKRIDSVLFKEYIIRRLCRMNGMKTSFPSYITKKMAFPAPEIDRFRQFQMDDEFYMSYISKQTYLQAFKLILPLKIQSSRAPVKNPLSWRYSRSNELVIHTKEELDVIGRALFYHLDKDTFGFISLSDWMRFFDSFSTGAIAFRHLFSHRRLVSEGTMSVTQKEFLSMLRDFFAERNALSASINAWDANLQVVKDTFSAMFFLLMVVVVGKVFGADIDALLVALGSILVSSAFAFGSTLSKFVESLVFVLKTKPYEVGDFVSIAGVTDRAIVTSMNVLTTTLREVNNQVFVVTNIVLSSKVIHNLSRSKNAVLMFEIEIRFNTPVSKLKALHTQLTEYLETHSEYKADRLEYFIKPLVNANSMKLHIWVESVSGWEDGVGVHYAYSQFLSFLRKKMNELGIRHQMPALPVLKRSHEE